MAAWALALCLLGARPAKAEIEISLVTVGAAESAYTRFAHTGLLVLDTRAPSRAVMYNFGYAPFGQPAFWVKMFLGTARFQLGRRPWEQAIERYRAENRSVTTQRLALSEDEASRIARELVRIHSSEDRFYVYDHRTVNCSTRVRDLLDAELGGLLHAQAGDELQPRSWRSYAREAAGRTVPLALGFEAIWGTIMVRHPTAWDQLGLPEEFRERAEGMQRELDGRTVPLVEATQVVVQREGPPATGAPDWYGPLLVVATGLAVAIGLLADRRRGPGPFATAAGAEREVRWRRRVSGAVLVLWSLAAGILGFLIWMFRLAGALPDLAENENMWIFFPADAWLGIAGVAWFRGRGVRLRRWIRRYAVLHLMVAALAILARIGGLLIQDNAHFYVACGIVYGALAYCARAGAKTPAPASPGSSE